MSSSNATEIAKLTGDIKLASEKHHNLADELVLTRAELSRTRAELSEATRQTAEKLDATQADLERARTTLAAYEDKPWLAESGRTAPWADSLRAWSRASAWWKRLSGTTSWFRRKTGNRFRDGRATSGGPPPIVEAPDIG